jgi:hypothetical protein
MAVFARVQGATLDTSGTSVTMAFTTQNETAGNMATCAIRFGTTSTTTGVSDSSGNSWTKIDTNTDTGAETLELWYALNIAGGVKPTVTITSTTSTTIRALLEEWSGVKTSSALDQHAITGQISAGTTLTVTTAGSTADASELAIGYGQVSGTTTFTKGAAYTLGSVIPAGAGAKIATEYRELVSTGTQTATFTVSSNPWEMGIATFKAASVSSATLMGQACL